jgi:hypothetical protein
VGAQCDGADPLDHGQSSPVLFPRAESVAALPVSLFSVKALTFFRRKVVQAGNLKGICGLSRCPVPRGSSGRYWLCRTRGRLDIELLGRRTDRALAHWIKGPMAIERLDLATALPSMARSVLRCSLGPRSEAVSTTRMATCHLSRPWSREVAWGRQCDCIHSAGVILLAGLVTI